MPILSPELQAKGYAAGLNLVVEGKAEIHKVPGGYVVRPDARQAKVLQGLMERKLSTSRPAAVKLDLAPAYMPVALRRAVPAALLTLAVGYVLGKAF